MIDLMNEVSPLIVPECEMRTNCRTNILAVSWRQWLTERHLARRGISIRSTTPSQVAAAYAALSEKEFDAINGRQAWANWRTIPRAMSGHVPDGPLRVVDLGCGTGGSTRVLAYFCPPGSLVTGYEVAGPLLSYARRQTYVQRCGGAARVNFVCQAITERLRDGTGKDLPRASVDLVNATGVIGHHLTRESLTPLLAEIVRISKPRAVAMLDFGPTMPLVHLNRILAQQGFRPLSHARSWIGDPTGLATFRKEID